MDAKKIAFTLIFVGLVVGPILSCGFAFTITYDLLHPNSSDFWQNSMAIIFALLVAFTVLTIWGWIWVFVLELTD